VSRAVGPVLEGLEELHQDVYVLAARGTKKTRESAPQAGNALGRLDVGEVVEVDADLLRGRFGIQEQQLRVVGLWELHHVREQGIDVVRDLLVSLVPLLPGCLLRGIFQKASQGRPAPAEHAAGDRIHVLVEGTVLRQRRQGAPAVVFPEA
jgi:hypothetical protein